MKRRAIEDVFNDGANILLSEIMDMHDLHMPIYYSAVAVQKHLFVLGMIADLLTHIREFTSNKNLFLISDTAQFLQQLIKGSDTPFVYERTGTFIHHFMIDEFQDTSALQWNNFRPLILNSLAENNENWIVGDVKQSIYRWRNSDWTILSEKVFNDLKPFQINEETLTYNWRSSRNIISFNNSFFRNAIAILLSSVAESYRESNSKGFGDFEQLFTKAYSDFMQLVPEHKNIDRGMVDIQVIAKNDDKSFQFEDEALERLQKIIEEIQDHHYDLKDVAILVRERSEGDMISDFLLKCQQKMPGRKYKYDILSNDSLLLKNSEVIKWIISAFKYIVNPSDQLNKAFLAYEYSQYLNKANEPAFSHMFDHAGNVRIPEKIEAFFKQKNLRHYPVYELCDKIILHFGLAQLKNELPFIQAFQDMLMDYTRKESSDLNSFLYWWEENEDKRVLNMPEEQDAIRLMTLHSAKGLEFKIVIVPFANWSFMKAGWSSNIIWCKTNKEPFNVIDMVPLNFSKGLQNTIFSTDYIHEQALSYIDNLNLLYVAFTRAVDAFYVIVPEQEKETIDNVGALITTAIDNQFCDTSQKFPAVSLGDYWSRIDKHLVFGSMPLQDEKIPVDESKELDNTYTVRPVSDVVKQVVQARDYFTEEGEMLASRINVGRVMHEVFQRIKTKDDIDNALLFLLMEGKIQKNDLQILSSKIKESISRKPVADWFSSDWEVLTETGILLKTGAIPRPDRVLIKGTTVVVIDYKFGESEHSSHLWQVRNYMQYLKQMNNRDVSGYLWYPNLKKVVAVDFTVVQGTLF
jgi:ATP-dependent exoDNAse (exonuclease V) beta subunit